MDQKRREEIRARWSGGMTGRYSTATEEADYRDVTELLDEVERLTPRTVSTVEELEALSDEAIVLNPGVGDVWARIPGASLWGGAGCESPDSSEFLIRWGAPLTVVWQP